MLTSHNGLDASATGWFEVKPSVWEKRHAATRTIEATRCVWGAHEIAIVRPFARR